MEVIPHYQGKKGICTIVSAGRTVDTTGAGDTFCGSVLNYLLEHDVDHLTEEQLIEMLRISNAAAYLVTTKGCGFVLCRIRMKSKKLLKVNSTHIFNLCITVFIQFMQSFLMCQKQGVYELSIKLL